MQKRRHPDWRFRLALALDLILGSSWGILLGLMLVRINSQFPPPMRGLIGVPFAFLGSMLVTIVFHRMLPSFPKVIRLLVLFLIVGLSALLGLVGGGIIERGNTPTQLLDAAGAQVWELELGGWVLGHVGGTWTGWTIPLFKSLRALVRLMLALVLRLLRAGLSIPRRGLEMLVRILAWVGHGCLSFSRRLSRAIRRPFQQIQARWARFATSTPTLRDHEPANGALAPRTIRRGKKPVRRRAHRNKGPRLLKVVDERCPYCLDVIKPSDPRGIRICEICGALHHADCWGITGKCQVPHVSI